MAFLAYPLAVAAGLMAAQAAAPHIGRLQVAITGKILGTSCLFAMPFAPNVSVALVLFVLRVAFMRSGKSMERAILMDVTPKSMRGMWSSLENIVQFDLYDASIASDVGRFSFSGSAAIGGWIADQTNYETCFIITGVIYSLAMIPLFILIPVIKDVDHDAIDKRLSQTNFARNDYDDDAESDSRHEQMHLARLDPVLDADDADDEFEVIDFRSEKKMAQKRLLESAV